MKSLQNKRILLFAPKYYGYEVVLARELEKKGATVTYVENKPFIHDPINKGTPWYLKIFCRKEKYLSKIVFPASKNKYDIFFVVDLFSFRPQMVENLRLVNPDIQCLLYLWDNARGYHWKQFFKHFDFTYTFDPAEAKEHNLTYWPNFWPIPNHPEGHKKKYDVCCVASFQVHRLNTLEAESERPEAQRKNIFFYIYLPPVHSKLIYNSLIYFVTQFFPNRYQGYKKMYRLIYKKTTHPLIKYKPLPLNEAVNVIESSKCVIDLPYHLQTGSTQRVINALGLKKKVITTNQSIKEEMFYNPEFIKIVSPANFEIDWNWIEAKPNTEMNLDYLRIDNWIDKLLP
jgi:hypothetical protein